MANHRPGATKPASGAGRRAGRGGAEGEGGSTGSGTGGRARGAYPPGELTASHLLESADLILGEEDAEGSIPPVRPIDSGAIPGAPEGEDSPALGNIGPGARVGNYQILRKIGEGGMAAIFLAQDLRRHRPIALKALHRKQASGLGAKRFKREFRALSRICHPNVVRVYEYGMFQDQPWFVMEYVPGKDLKAALPILHKRPPKERWRQIESILVQSCRALEAIHSRGIIHRDLKPSNILMMENGLLKLTDFGVARPRDVSVRLTAENMLVGTLAYLAPEAFEKDELTFRVDLYALGVMLYSLLTGQLPFRGRTIADMMHLHVQVEPDPPRQRNPDVPDHLEALCLRLLAKDPGARYSSAAEVIRVLHEGRDTPVPRQLTLEEGGSFIAGVETLWTPPIVGRQNALAPLHKAIEETSLGRGGVLFLEGVRGVGKTRLAEAALAHAREMGLHVHRADCIPGGRGWCEGLKGLVASVASEVEHSQDRKLLSLYGQALESVGDLDGPPPSPEGRQEMPLSQRPESGGSFEAALGRSGPNLPGPSTTIEALFRHLCRLAPRVLFVDNLEGADTGTVSALGALIRNVARTQPLLLIGAIELGDTLPLPGVRALINGERTGMVPRVIGLGPLGRTDLLAIVSDLLPRDDRTQILLHRLHREAGGNPLHVVELLRLFRQRGYISKEASGQDGSHKLGLTQKQLRSAALKLPGSLTDVIEERLEPLPAATRTLLKLMAAWERDVGLDRLLKITNARDELLLSHIDRLLAEGVLVERWVAGRERYDFAHPAFREAVLKTLSESEAEDLRHAILTRYQDELEGKG